MSMCKYRIMQACNLGSSNSQEVKDVASASPPSLRLLPRVLLHALLAVAVVDLALLSVRQHLVGCGRSGASAQLMHASRDDASHPSHSQHSLDTHHD